MTREEAIMVLKNEQPHCGKKALFPEEKKYEAYDMAIKALEQEPTEKCTWIKYDYRTICPKECGGENPYWRIPENMENLKYCPYCGKEIEVEE